MISDKLKELLSSCKKNKTKINGRKVTQRVLADVLGVTPSCVSMYVGGSRKVSFEDVCKLADFFDVPLDYFREDKDD